MDDSLILTPEQVEKITIWRGGPEADRRHQIEMDRVMKLISEGKIGPKRVS